MKLNKAILAAAAAALLASGSSLAAEQPDVLITKVPGANGGQIFFEFVSNGNVAGLQFEFRVPGLTDANLRRENCVAGLNDAIGFCNLVDDVFKVAILGNNLKPIESGQLGSIAIENFDLASAELQVTNLVFSSPESEEIEGGGFIDQRSPAEWRGMESDR